MKGPAAAFGAVGLDLLAAGAVLSWVGHTDDPVLAPGERPSGGAGARLLSALSMPAVTTLALTLAVHLLA